MNKNLIHLLISIISFLGGALNISCAVITFQKQDYFIFGMHVMVVIMMSALMVKSYFDRLNDLL